MRNKKLRVADLFCGAGGTSTGALMAAEAAGVQLDLTAVNHWDVAIETHSANHPGARHVCADINDVRPERFFKRGQLDWLFASPECTHHSRARGGLPMDDQRRCGARRVLDWAERIYPERIWVENVQEFQDWGPLDRHDRPIQRLKGALYQEWVQNFRTLGYSVEARVQNAANFGAPTTRQRLIVQAARRGTRLVWPEPTHRQASHTGELFGDLPEWLSARDHVIDWSIPCPSIFGRARPLSPNTLRRIEAGLRAQGIQAFLTNVSHSGDRIRSLDDPLNTITTCTGETALVQPFLVTLRGTGDNAAYSSRPVTEPLSTVATSGAHHCLVTPCLIPQQSDGRLRPVTEPAPTVSTAGAIGLMQPTLIEYYGTGTHASCDEPLHTVTTKPRFGLAVPLKGGGEGLLDIGYRMLRWRENARAQSFPDSYQFKGRTEAIIHKQIGNAVPPKLAEAHARAALQQMERREA